MPSVLVLFHIILLSTTVIINAEDKERANHNTEFFITMPRSTTVFIPALGDASQSLLQDTDNKTWAEFQCVTRPGYIPLWIINGVSADIIEHQPGYVNTTYELIPLHDRGHTLTILSIPASRLTNHSVVTCAAVENETKLNIVGYSIPVNLVVLIKANPGNSALISVGAQTTTLSTPNSVSYVMNTTTVANRATYPPATNERTPALSPQLISGLGAGSIVVLLAIALLLMFVVIITLRRKNRSRHRLRKVSRRAGQSNVYWNSFNVSGLVKMNQINHETDGKPKTMEKL